MAASDAAVLGAAYHTYNVRARWTNLYFDNLCHAYILGLTQINRCGLLVNLCVADISGT